jgi:hypothetical protein
MRLGKVLKNKQLLLCWTLEDPTAPWVLIDGLRVVFPDLILNGPL